MQNATDPTAQPGVKHDSLGLHRPPAQVSEAPSGVIETNNNEHLNDDPGGKENKIREANGAEEAQEDDWENGEPGIVANSPENAGHKTPEVENDQALRENKGEMQGDNLFEASEEVNTGQNAG